MGEMDRMANEWTIANSIVSTVDTIKDDIHLYGKIFKVGIIFNFFGIIFTLIRFYLNFFGYYLKFDEILFYRFE